MKNETTPTKQELVDNSISIIHVFFFHIYGLLNYKKGLSEDESLQDRNTSNASSD